MKSIPAIAILTILLILPSVVSAASSCSFNAPSPTLAFGSLDPGIGANVTVTATVTFTCRGGQGNSNTYAITDNGGLYRGLKGAGANMRNGTVVTEYLPYSFTYAPATGTVSNNAVTTLSITGTVQGIDFMNAYVGGYSDSVTLTIAP